MTLAQTVSSDDARRFRESASVPLQWEETAPVLPINRIEFTRRILEAARKTGVTVSAWNTCISDDDPEKRFLSFQKALASSVPKQALQSSPTDKFSWWLLGYESHTRGLNWGKYIEQLERDYTEPWDTAWNFGASPASRENLRSWLIGWLSDSPRISNFVSTAHIAQSDAEKINGNELIADLMNLQYGDHLSLNIESKLGLKIRTMREFLLGLPAEISMFIPFTLSIVCSASAIYGAETKHFSRWWLFFIFPMIFVGIRLLFALAVKTNHFKWIDKQLTVDQLFDKIIAEKTRDWADLQHADKEN